MIEIKLHKTELWSVWSAVLEYRQRLETELKHSRYLTADGEVDKRRKLHTPIDKDRVQEYERTKRLWFKLDEEIEKTLSAPKGDGNVRTK